MTGFTVFDICYDFTVIFQLLETKLEQDVGNLKAYGAALTTQIDGLRMIPMLFGMINFLSSSNDNWKVHCNVLMVLLAWRITVQHLLYR